MIQFSCGECEKAYRVPDHYAGKKLRCKDCGTIIPIPSSEFETTACGDSVAAFNELLQQLAHDEKTSPSLESNV